MKIGMDWRLVSQAAASPEGLSHPSIGRAINVIFLEPPTGLQIFIS
jgi:hypothetical protein